MGLGSFTGYETMVFFLALFLYGAMPLCTAAYAYCYQGSCCTLSPLRRLALAPIISVCLLLIIRCFFLFVFSEAGMGLVFQWRVQFFISLVVCWLFVLYDKRAIFQKRPVLRWGLTALTSLAVGMTSVLMLFTAESNINFFPVGNPSFKYPHGFQALYASLLGSLLLILLTFGVLYPIHPLTKGKRKVLLLVSLAACLSAGLCFFLILDWTWPFLELISEFLFSY